MSTHIEARPQHTPGPWESTKVPTSAGYAWQTSPIGACLYVDRYGGVCNPRMPDGEAEANARLIAAAPDLLAALEEIMDEAEARAPNFLSDISDGPYQRARAAIAKATGSEP